MANQLADSARENIESASSDAPVGFNAGTPIFIVFAGERTLLVQSLNNPTISYAA